MQIKPIDRTISQVLESGYYRIPRFQRPYSWDKENVDDFWTDAIANDAPDYFIGSFVFYREKDTGSTYMIVDGQQRLTTVTLLLAAVRDALDMLGLANPAKGIQKLIEREDINNQPQFVLQTESSYPFLQEYIQKHGSPQVKKPSGGEQEALELASDHLRDKVAAVLKAVDDDPAIVPAKKTREKERRLLRIRDRALRLQLIVVELTNEDDAYLIFETMNTRGKDLGLADLVKNYLTRMLRPKTKGVDLAKDKWNSILALFDASAADLDMSSFVYHAWLSRYPYVGKERVFKELKIRIKDHAVGAYLDGLVADADLYRQVLEPSAYRWSKQEREVAASLRALNIFRVVQPVPMTLSILRAYRADGLTLNQTRSILRDMENFHVQFTAVTAQRTGGGTARMYAATAEELTVAKDKNKRAQVLKDFKDKMRKRIPGYEEFAANFKEIDFLSDNTKQKALVQYLLQRFDAHSRSGPPADYEAMTIEHIAPEKPPGGAAALPNVGRLGNLILLPEDVNSKLGNADFATKRAAYAKHDVPLDQVLKNASTWTPAEINLKNALFARFRAPSRGNR